MPAEVRWYFSESGEVRGPLPESELIRLARAGQVKPTEYILREGHQEWLPAKPLIENCHALPVDGEARHAAFPGPTATPEAGPPAVIPDAAADEPPGMGNGFKVGLVLLGVIAAGLMAAFAWYMLAGPGSEAGPDDAAPAAPPPAVAAPPAPTAAPTPAPAEGDAGPGGAPAEPSGGASPVDDPPAPPPADPVPAADPPAPTPES